jgi:carbamoyl-phosphate synthase small subunit
MNCIISSEILDVEELKKLLDKVPKMEGLELSSKVSTKQSYFFGEASAKNKIAVIDFGVKKNILRSLSDRNTYLKVFPMTATVAEVLEFKPDGIMLSNGPGDPGAMPKESAFVKELVETNIPVFGICLGHQLLAQSQGISTFKMHAGHRGINSPVKNLISGKSEITSQNHGFSVNPDDIAKNPNIEITHVNLNDQTIEGIRVKNKNAFSVQYHPEACPGPLDARYLFDEFITMVEKVKSEKTEMVK